MSHLTLFSLTSGLLTGQVDPPPYFLIVIQIYNFDTFLESSWALLQYNLQKMSNLQKSKDLLRNLVIKQKCAKKNWENRNKLYIFENLNVQKHVQNL